MISIKYRPTFWVLALEYSDVQWHGLPATTRRTRCRAGLEAVYLHDDLAHLHGDVVLDTQELGEPQITHLASPHPLHCLDVQVLETQDVVLTKPKGVGFTGHFVTVQPPLPGRMRVAL